MPEHLPGPWLSGRAGPGHGALSSATLGEVVRSAMDALKSIRDCSSVLNRSFRAEVRAWRTGSRSDFRFHFRVFVSPEKLGINQEPELVTGPLQDCFGESHAVVTEKAQCFCYGLFDGVPREFCRLLRRDGMEFDMYPFQVQDAFGPERAGHGIQARHLPVAGKSSFGILEAATIRPVVNPVPEGIHGIRQLEQVAARQDLAAFLEERRALCLPPLLLPGRFLSLQLRGATCLKPGSAESGQTSDEGTQQARDRTRHDRRI